MTRPVLRLTIAAVLAASHSQFVTEFGLAADRDGPVAAPGSHRVWLPLDGQRHPTGTHSGSKDRGWISTWAAANQRGLLAEVSAGTLAPGDYTSVFQVYHKQYAGRKLGNMRLLQNGNVVEQRELVSETFPDFAVGGYQRGTLAFTIPQKGDGYTLNLDYYNNHYIWLGAVALHRNGRPIYVMGHHCNTTAKVQRMIEAGAIGVEFDIQAVEGPTSEPFEIAVYHAGDKDNEFTPAPQFDAFLREIKTSIDSEKLTLAMLDCKTTYFRRSSLLEPYVNPRAFKKTDLTNYARSVVAKLKAAGIHPQFVVLSVPKNDAAEFFAEVKKQDYACSLDAYFESYPSKETTPCDAIRNWAQGVEQTGATFAGVGLDEKVRGPFFTYAYWLNELLKRRDVSGKINKVWFWTVNNQRDTRRILDYGADGILTDNPAMVTSILREEPYGRIFRLASQDDSHRQVFSGGTAR